LGGSNDFDEGRESGPGSGLTAPAMRNAVSATSHRISASSAVAQSMASFSWPPQPPPSPPGPRADDTIPAERPLPEIIPVVAADTGVATAISIEPAVGGRIRAALEAIRASKAIAAKAAQIGVLPAGAEPDVDWVPGGAVARFDGLDIYYSDAAGAVQIYGAIKAKYDALGGPNSPLGLPHTDELGTPDGQGRFNHFAGGSIYWTKRTGPMSVRGAILDLWGSLGWEKSSLGYPVQDQHRFVTLTPSGPFIEWCEFENGFIASNTHGAWVAPYAEINPGDLMALVRLFVDKELHESPDNVGLHPRRESTGVGDWAEGFWRAHSRAVGFRLHGFGDNGGAPDSDFAINLWLRFDLVWSLMQFTEPRWKSLVASLDWLRVTEEDRLDTTFGGTVKGVSEGICHAFFPPDGPHPGHPEVPAGAVFVEELPCVNDLTDEVDRLGVQVSPTGSLRFYVSPLQSGNWPDIFNWPDIRVRAVQKALDDMWARLEG
jgi:hypothetical protein